ncbi:E3 ubiquitin-protein ligase TRIM39-like isoform X2 [Chanos chanos]|uniref:E3 ubiquitin-protein ligase TRIM39-like isoform X2 n=1 Tax=Chanos chanos TaxID=29144 RepID=A0A6J2VQZ9_CHACN|nr:E3 ubiquitin-protein ligase TRIM39-like isoform X2 [Chanos chanos]
MASSSSLLSEEQFQCPICLDVFTDPVSTPCGHNFCMTCIKGFWDSSDSCRCPMCKRKFEKRPELFVNTMFADLTAQFRKSVEVKASSILQIPAVKTRDISCDICTEEKRVALKSCLVCLTSYCETHLEPHQRVSALKKHKLIDPVENVEDYICKKHERPLELFCRDDQTCVCQFCTEGEHRTHNTVPIEEESGEKRTQIGKTQTEVQQMIQDRLKKIEEIRHSVEINKRVQAELLEVMEEKQKATEKEAEGVIKELEQEISDLKRRDTELEQLSHTEDLLHLLQIHPSVCSPPHTKNWSDISIKTAVSVDTLRRSQTQIEESFSKAVEKITEIDLKNIQLFAVDVTLDPVTAHPNLILSDDGKDVRNGNTRQNLPDSSKRFDTCCSVLGKEGFSSGRFYYEVEVKGKTDWDLGMARESINRKGNITLNPKNGFWTVWLRNGKRYEANASPSVLLSLKHKPQKVGVFVDYEEGVVSFYDVEARSHIYSFTGQSFTGKLYPYFSPSPNLGGKNSAPLIITPISQTE